VSDPAAEAQSRITAFWSLVARDYEAHEGNVPARDSAEFAAWVDAVAGLLPGSPADVLDIATGTGFVALIAASLGHRVTAIDLSAEMLGVARASASELGLAVVFDLRDAVEPGFAGRSFDAAICRHFLWTLREPLRALEAWRHLLRPGGRAVAIDGFWLGEPASDEGAGEEPSGLFEQYYTRETREALPVSGYRRPEETAALFREAGFVEVGVSQLTPVHALAEDPPGPEPWYVITAFAPR
jgi:SAM-dependent methyltransferase